MNMIIYVQLYLLSIAPACLCWQYFTSFNDWKLTTSSAVEYLHSEYFFGKCFKSQGGIYYTHLQFNHLQVLGKLILRVGPHQMRMRARARARRAVCQLLREVMLHNAAVRARACDAHAYGIRILIWCESSLKVIGQAWINVPRIPTCIILRGTSGENDLFRYTSYNFQVCVPRITYCHAHTRYKYHFLEWYIPANYTGGMDWDIFFYGPRRMEW